MINPELAQKIRQLVEARDFLGADVQGQIDALFSQLEDSFENNNGNAAYDDAIARMG